MNNYLIERTVPGLHAHLVSSLSSINRTEKILDVGCGTGAWLNRLSENGFNRLVGIDQNTEQFVPENIKVISANLDTDNITLSEGPFGLITAIEIVEHLSNVGRFLEFANANLNQNGKILISTPNVNSVTSSLKFLITKELRHFDSHGDPTHISPVFIHPFKSLLAMYQFEIDEIWTYPQSSTDFGSTGLSKFASRLASLIIKNPYPGDILCMIIKRNT